MTDTAHPSLFVPVARLVDDGRTPLAVLFGADFSALSITPSRADSGPAVVRAALPRFASYDADLSFDLGERCVVDLGDAGASHCAWADAFAAIAATAGSAYVRQRFAIALGGDHSVTWPLAATFRDHCTRLGIVQLDVHHDVRPLDAGPSNGTPIRGLVEEGYVYGEDIVQVGIHPFANRHELGEYCDLVGIVRHSLAKVATEGVVSVVARALAQLAPCDAIYLTVDIDVLDRAFAPGTVAALPGGIAPATLATLVAAFCADARVRAMDVVEFDPSRDVQGITAHNVAYMVMTALSAVARRERAHE